MAKRKEKKEFIVTFSIEYRGKSSVLVTAESEEEAKDIAEEKFPEDFEDVPGPLETVDWEFHRIEENR